MFGLKNAILAGTREGDSQNISSYIFRYLSMKMSRVSMVGVVSFVSLQWQPI